MKDTKKQSSIDWLISKLPLGVKFGIIDKIEQAKQMHKDEMIEAMNKAQIIDDVDFDGNVTFIFNNIEQYYNDTFGS